MCDDVARTAAVLVFEPRALTSRANSTHNDHLAHHALTLALSAPGSMREAFDRGGFYVFSREFLEDIPKRVTGPGRLRFVFQPLIAIFLGIRSGIDDARSGRPPYLIGLITLPEHRRELLKSGFRAIVNIVLMGILLDSIMQGSSSARRIRAAVVIGPALVAVPYAVTRAVTNRVTRAKRPSLVRNLAEQARARADSSVGISRPKAGRARARGADRSRVGRFPPRVRKRFWRIDCRIE
jgi:hypothetical protein